MRGWVLRFIINAIAVAVIASGLLPGIRIVGEYWPTLIFAALAIGIVNAIVKPIVLLLTCPIVLLTLGLVMFVINGAMLYLVSALTGWLTFIGGVLYIDNFWWAILGAVIVSLINIVLERITGLKGGRSTRVVYVKGQTVVQQKRSQYDQEFDRFLQDQERRPPDPFE